MTGALRTGWAESAGGRSYILHDGSLAAGEQPIDGGWYYFDPVTRAMVTGFADVPDGAGSTKRVFYGDDGAMRYGEQLIGGRWYHFDEVTGAMSTGVTDLGEKTVFYGDDGAMRYGLVEVPGLGERFFDEVTGAMARSQWVEINGLRNYCSQDGSIAVYIADDGSGNNVLYLPDGTRCSGWIVVDGCRMYADPVNGAMYYGEHAIDGNWYLFNSDGFMQTGFQLIGTADGGSKWVYYQFDGKMIHGEYCINGSWYYFNEVTGAVSYGWCVLPDGRTVYYDTVSGIMKYGAQWIDGYWYWFDRCTGALDRQGAINTIMSTANSLLGVPYVWLGVYPQDGGMDCASFTWYLYQQLGIDIGFETYDQMYSGFHVNSLAEALPGDLILMYYGGWPNYNPYLPEHVVLYAGNGMIYEEPDFNMYCRYVPLSAKGAAQIEIRRILR